MKILTDKVAIITGGSSGIGRATALLFAREGAKLVVTARRQSELDKLVAEIEQNGGVAIAVTGDVKDESHAKLAVGESSKSAKDPEGTTNTASGSAAAGGGAATQTSTAGTTAPSSSTSTGGTATTRANGETSGGGGNGNGVCSGPTSACVSDCGSSELVRQDTCQDGAWSCPNNHTLWTDCPLDSCARADVACCDDATGAIVQPPCGADEKFEACPADTRLLGPSYDCIPEDTGVTECSQLTGPCDSEELRCVSGGLWFCGTLCACTPDGAGTLSWQCGQVFCP